MTPAAGRAADPIVDPATVLTVFVVTLTLLPARYVLGPLGAAGTPAGVMAVLCLFWYLAAMINPATTPLRGRQPLRAVMLVLLCSMLASYAAAMGRNLPALETNGADRGLILVAGWVGIALLAADGITRLDRLEDVRRRLVLCCTIVGVLGLVQFFTGLDVASHLAFPGLQANTEFSSVLSRDGFNRPMATATHPIELGVVLVMALPLALHGLLYAPKGRRARRCLPVLVLLVTIPMTVSRSAILGLLVVGLVMLPVWPGRLRFWSLVVGGAGTVVMSAAVPGLIGTVSKLVLNIGSDSSTTARTDDYTAVARSVHDRPLFGQGFGTYLPRVYRILDNQYLGSLVETGLVGLAALLAVMLGGWFLARGARRASRDPETRHLAQCLAASVAVAAFAYGTFDAFSFPMAANLTFLLVGCGAALWRLARESPEVSSGAPARRRTRRPVRAAWRARTGRAARAGGTAGTGRATRTGRTARAGGTAGTGRATRTGRTARAGGTAGTARGAAGARARTGAATEARTGTATGAGTGADLVVRGVRACRRPRRWSARRCRVRTGRRR
ncbi:O-antigen ligase family protein [Actinomadura yumaensis]|uniref:O-antigen ligase family protein n=1 Tax=Actinomadura yumaensis TaxID=111807 RepID=UPI00361341A8